MSSDSFKLALFSIIASSKSIILSILLGEMTNKSTRCSSKHLYLVRLPSLIKLAASVSPLTFMIKATHISSTVEPVFWCEFWSCMLTLQVLNHAVAVHILHYTDIIIC
jgi:hypothetical protein